MLPISPREVSFGRKNSMTLNSLSPASVVGCKSLRTLNEINFFVDITENHSECKLTVKR